ncbi:MAG: 5-formyltetrahydrofolate cyclo-ligase [Rhodospirillales bacterium]
MAADDEIQSAKAALRARAKAARAEAAKVLSHNAPEHAAAVLTGALDSGALNPPNRIAAGYLTIGDELDPLPALRALSERGWRTAMPAVTAKDAPLEFRAWTPGCEMEDGPLRTRHPAEGAETLDPGLVLAPMLAFDAAGYRLGWGGGFYDRTIAQRRPGGAVFAGFAYSAQRTYEIPRGPHDMALDAVVTELGFEAAA